MIGVLELLQSGGLSADQWDWSHARDFRFSKDAEAEEAEDPGAGGGGGAPHAIFHLAPPYFCLGFMGVFFPLF